eukprot:g12326.t1
MARVRRIASFAALGCALFFRLLLFGLVVCEQTGTVAARAGFSRDDEDGSAAPSPAPRAPVLAARLAPVADVFFPQQSCRNGTYDSCCVFPPAVSGNDGCDERCCEQSNWHAPDLLKTLSCDDVADGRWTRWRRDLAFGTTLYRSGITELITHSTFYRCALGGGSAFLSYMVFRSVVLNTQLYERQRMYPTTPWIVKATEDTLEPLLKFDAGEKSGMPALYEWLLGVDWPFFSNLGGTHDNVLQGDMLSIGYRLQVPPDWSKEDERDMNEIQIALSLRKRVHADIGLRMLHLRKSGEGWATGICKEPMPPMPEDRNVETERERTVVHMKKLKGWMDKDYAGEASRGESGVESSSEDTSEGGPDNNDPTAALQIRSDEELFATNLLLDLRELAGQDTNAYDAGNAIIGAATSTSGTAGSTAGSTDTEQDQDRDISSEDPEIRFALLKKKMQLLRSQKFRLATLYLATAYSILFFDLPTVKILDEGEHSVVLEKEGRRLINMAEECLKDAFVPYERRLRQLLETPYLVPDLLGLLETGMRSVIRGKIHTIPATDSLSNVVRSTGKLMCTEPFWMRLVEATPQDLESVGVEDASATNAAPLGRRTSARDNAGSSGGATKSSSGALGITRTFDSFSGDENYSAARAALKRRREAARMAEMDGGRLRASAAGTGEVWASMTPHWEAPVHETAAGTVSIAPNSNTKTSSPKSSFFLVEVGTHTGDCALYALHKFGKRLHAVGFEPNRIAYQTFKRSIFAHEAHQHMKVEHAIIGNQVIGGRGKSLYFPTTRTAETFLDTENSCAGGRTDCEHGVLATTLDEYFRGQLLSAPSRSNFGAEVPLPGYAVPFESDGTARSPPVIDILKLHCQFCELNALKGARELLAGNKVCVILGRPAMMSTERIFSSADKFWLRRRDELMEEFGAAELIEVERARTADRLSTTKKWDDPGATATSPQPSDTTPASFVEQKIERQIEQEFDAITRPQVIQLLKPVLHDRLLSNGYELFLVDDPLFLKDPMRLSEYDIARERIANVTKLIGGANGNAEEFLVDRMMDKIKARRFPPDINDEEQRLDPSEGLLVAVSAKNEYCRNRWGKRLLRIWKSSLGDGSAAVGYKLSTEYATSASMRARGTGQGTTSRGGKR